MVNLLQTEESSHEFFLKEKKYIFLKWGKKWKLNCTNKALKDLRKTEISLSFFSFLTVPTPKKHENDINHKCENQAVVIFTFTQKSQV